jgi:hypothetical protein
LGSIRQAEPLLARYGHCTIAAGSLLVLVGGMLRDSAHKAVDVSVLDLVSRRMIQPSLSGTPPPALRHLCSAPVALKHSSLLHTQVGAVTYMFPARAAACFPQGSGILTSLSGGAFPCTCDVQCPLSCAPPSNSAARAAIG